MAADDRSGDLAVALSAAASTLEHRARGAMRGVRARLFPAAERPPNILAGRYRMLERVGSGAQGAVWIATDQLLRRRVAIKFARRGTGTTAAVRHSVRLEAQALARLSHPNIVGVFGFGTCTEAEVMDGGRTDTRLAYLVMEHIDGITLSQWAGEPHRTGASLRVFREICAGLQAAHDVGIVHRDIKPSNVLLGKDGRVRIADFGLASGAVDFRSSEPNEDATAEHSGPVVGTPLYMAPEVLAGDPASAASDQYAAAVLLHELLYGRPAHLGRNLSEIEGNKRGGAAPQPRPQRLSATAYRALGLALEPDPAHRHPSVSALCRAVVRPRRRATMVLAGAVAVLPLGALAVAQMSGPPACDGRERLEGIWDGARRSQIRAAMTGASENLGARTWPRVERRFDAYAQGWTDAYRQACQSAEERDEPADRYRLTCLDRALAEFRALTDELIQADTTLVAGAIEGAAALPPPSMCEERSRASHPEPASLAAPELEQQIDRAWAHFRGGSFAEAGRLADDAAGRAREAGHVPSTVRAHLLLGMILRREERYAAARTELLLAYRLADEHNMRGPAGSAATELAVVARNTVELDRADEWARHALAHADAAGDARIRVLALETAGFTTQARGDYQRAHQYFVRSANLAELELVPGDPARARALRGLALSLSRIGDQQRALDQAQRALAAYEEAFGPDHPALAEMLTDLGELRLGNPSEARESFVRALEVVEMAFGPGHARASHIHFSLGQAANAERDWVEARREFMLALKGLESGGRGDTPDAAECMTGIAMAELKLGRTQQAEAHLARARAALSGTVASGHPKVAHVLYLQASASRQRGDIAGARDLYRQSIEELEKSLGPAHADVAHISSVLGRLELRAGRLSDARGLFERALTIERGAAEPNLGDIANLEAQLRDVEQRLAEQASRQ